MASNIAPATQGIRDMVAQFENISVQMGEPGADIDALAGKMDRLQVSHQSYRKDGQDPGGSPIIQTVTCDCTYCSLQCRTTILSLK